MLPEMLRRRTAMPPKPIYSTLPAEDVESAGVQPLELEHDHATRQDHRSKRRKFVLTATCMFALLVVMAGYGARKGGGTTKAPTKHNGGGESQTENEEPRHIFCYGDSLTFGMVGMHTPQQGSFPYAKFLQEELNFLFDPEFNTSAYNESDHLTVVPPTLVEHLGLPGWTAEQMVNHLHDEKVGICRIIERIPNLSLMIILVGTNDIAQMTETSKDVARTIISQIVDVHKGAFECAEDADAGNTGPKRNLHTLALSIPGSLYQEKVPITYDLASYVNKGMETFAKSYPGGEVTFVDFPFPYKEGDSKWSKDGIHLTKEGYETLAKELAPQVKGILDKIDSE